MIVCQLLNGMSAQGTQVQHEIKQEMRTVEEQIRSELDYCESSTILKITENNLNNAQFLSLLKGFGALCNDAKKIMVGKLLQIPQDRHAAFVDFIKPFILKGRHSDAMFFRGASIDPKDYAHYHKMILPLYNMQCFDSYKKRFYAEILLGTPTDKLTESFMTFSMPFLLKDINSYLILIILTMINPKDYAHYHKMVLPLYEMNFFDSGRKSNAVEKLLRMPAERLTENFMTFVNDITPLFSRYNIPEAIDLAYHYPQEVYPQLKESCKKLAVGVSFNAYDSIFNALIQIPIQQHPTFITVVDKFYNAIKKDKINIIIQLAENASNSLPYRYMRYLNIPQYEFDLFKKFSKLVKADAAIDYLEEIPEQNLTPVFYKMIKRLANGLKTHYVSLYIKNLKNINLNKIKEEHYQFIEKSMFDHDSIKNRILNSCLCVENNHNDFIFHENRIFTFYYILNIEKNQLTNKFKDVLQKYVAYNCYKLMLNTLTYDELMRTTSFKAPENSEVTVFFTAAKYMLLQETPQITLERFIEFYNMAKNCILDDFENMHQNMHLTFIDFCLGHPRFLSCVPRYILRETLDGITDKNEFLRILNCLYREYYISHQQRQQNYAHEVHNYSNFLIQTNDANKTSFNTAVMNYIRSKVPDSLPSFENTKQMLRYVFNEVLTDPLKPVSLTEETLTWCMNRILKEEEDTFIATYQYVEMSAPNHVKTWLQTFLDESTNAYGAQKGSCVRGIQERLVTSLRNLPLTDEILLSYFAQAESAFTNQTKVKRITDYPYWAQMLKKKGCTQNQNVTEVQQVYEQLLREYFAPITPDAEEIIKSTLEVFNDSSTHSRDSIWTKIKEVWPV